MQRLDCDFIAGCDGFHGVCRASVPKDAITEYEKVYPFGWLGVLSRHPAPREELVYVEQPPRLRALLDAQPRRSRYYLQVPLTERPEDWTDDAFWRRARAEARRPRTRAARTGRLIEKSIAPLRSFVAEPLRFGRLFLAGDAGHIVPPTGAKGLNLAATDVKLLASALVEHYTERASRDWSITRNGPCAGFGGPSASLGGSPR